MGYKCKYASQELYDRLKQTYSNYAFCEDLFGDPFESVFLTFDQIFARDFDWKPESGQKNPWQNTDDTYHKAKNILEEAIY